MPRYVVTFDVIVYSEDEEHATDQAFSRVQEGDWDNSSITLVEEEEEAIGEGP